MKTGERERTSHGPTGPRDVMDPHVHVDERVDLRRLTSRVSPLTTNPTTSDADGRPHSYDDVPAIVTWTDVITMGGHVVSTIELVWCRHGRRSREVGPAVVELLFSGEFRPDPLVAMFAAGGVVAASATQIAGQVLVAHARTGRLALAWIVGLAVALVLLVVGSGPPAAVVAAAFGVGTVTALGMVALLSIRTA